MKISTGDELEQLVFDFYSRHHVLQGFLELLLKLGMRERFAREHLVAHRGVVHEDSLHERGLR